MAIRKKITWVEESCQYPELGNCFVCTSHHIGNAGYVSYLWNGIVTHMSRFIYEQCFSPIPNNLHVLHKCDNRKCINPEHLFLGTNKDNACDRTIKGRSSSRKGECNGRSKLKAEDIQIILSDKRQYKNIAESYNVNPSTISAIKRGIHWINVI